MLLSVKKKKRLCFGKGLHDLVNTVGQCGEMVSPLQEGNNFSLTALTGCIEKHDGELTVSLRGKIYRGQGIGPVGVESRRDEDDVRPEFIQGGYDLRCEYCKILSVAVTAIHGEIHGETFAGTVAFFKNGTGAGKMGILVKTYIENGIVPIKSMLGAVAVMDIPVDYGNSA